MRTSCIILSDLAIYSQRHLEEMYAKYLRSGNLDTWYCSGLIFQ